MAPRRGKDWFDAEAFREELYPLTFPERRFAAAGEEIAKIL